MKRPSESNRQNYLVKKGEQVRFEISAPGKHALVTGAVNGDELARSGSSAQPVLSFVANSPKTYSVMIQFSFTEEDPPQAAYTMRLSGSEGGRFDDLRTVSKQAPKKEMTFRFDVDSAA